MPATQSPPRSKKTTRRRQPDVATTARMIAVYCWTNPGTWLAARDLCPGNAALSSYCPPEDVPDKILAKAGVLRRTHRRQLQFCMPADRAATTRAWIGELQTGGEED